MVDPVHFALLLAAALGLEVEPGWHLLVQEKAAERQPGPHAGQPAESRGHARAHTDLSKIGEGDSRPGFMAKGAASLRAGGAVAGVVLPSVVGGVLYYRRLAAAGSAPPQALELPAPGDIVEAVDLGVGSGRAIAFPLPAVFLAGAIVGLLLAWVACRLSRARRAALRQQKKLAEFDAPAHGIAVKIKSCPSLEDMFNCDMMAGGAIATKVACVAPNVEQYALWTPQVSAFDEETPLAPL